MIHIYDENGFCFECNQRQPMNETVKQAGLDSVKQLSKLTGQSPQTLKNWYLYKVALFNIVLIGSVEYKRINIID